MGKLLLIQYKMDYCLIVLVIAVIFSTLVLACRDPLALDVKANEIESYPPLKTNELKRKHMGPGRITFLAGGGTLFAAGAALLFAIHLNRAKKRDSLSDSRTTSGTMALEESPQIPPFKAVSLQGPRRLPPVKHSRKGEEASNLSFSKVWRHLILAAILAASIQGTFRRTLMSPTPAHPSPSTLSGPWSGLPILAGGLAALLVFAGVGGFLRRMTCRDYKDSIIPNLEMWRRFLIAINNQIVVISACSESLADLGYAAKVLKQFSSASTVFSFLAMGICVSIIKYCRGCGLDREQFLVCCLSMISTGQLIMTVYNIWGRVILSRFFLPIITSVVESVTKDHGLPRENGQQEQQQNTVKKTDKNMSEFSDKRISQISEELNHVRTELRELSNGFAMAFDSMEERLKSLLNRLGPPASGGGSPAAGGGLPAAGGELPTTEGGPSSKSEATEGGSKTRRRKSHKSKFQLHANGVFCLVQNFVHAK